MEPIPPSKNPFSESSDPPFTKNLHHHHLEDPYFRQTTYHSSPANFDRFSPSLPYFSSMRSNIVPPQYIPPPPERRPIGPPFNYDRPPPLYNSDNNYTGSPNFYESEPYSRIPPPSYESEEYFNQIPYEENFYDYESRQRLGEIEYVPFERKYIDHVPMEKIEYVPVERSAIDYYAVEKKLEYAPVKRYETKMDYVPRQIVEHVPQTFVEYVPVRKQEMVPRERLQERVEYEPVERSFIHYPKIEKEFADDAEKSGRIRHDLVGAYFPAQVLDNSKSKLSHFGKNNVTASYMGQNNKDYLKSSYDFSGEQAPIIQSPQYGGNGNQYQAPPNYNYQNYQTPAYNNHYYYPQQPQGNNGYPYTYPTNMQQYQYPPNQNYQAYNYNQQGNFNNNQQGYLNQNPQEYNQQAYNNFNQGVGYNNPGFNNPNNTPAYSRNLETSKLRKEFDDGKAGKKSDLDNLKKQLEGGNLVK